MRARTPLLLAFGALLTAGPIAAQTPDCWRNRPRGLALHRGHPCDSPFQREIMTVPWDTIQHQIHLLDSLGAFDMSPWASDRQTLVFRGNNGMPTTGPVAMVAARRDVSYLVTDSVEAGRFIGMIHSADAVPELGIFPGKTFVWVDRRGEGPDPWRSLLFPLESSQPRANILDIFGPPLLQGEGVGEARAVHPAVHLIYRARLIRVPFGDDAPHEGAFWSTAFYAGPVFHGIGFMAYVGPETIACFVCDRMMCCPTEFELMAFDNLAF